MQQYAPLSFEPLPLDPGSFAESVAFDVAGDRADCARPARSPDPFEASADLDGSGQRLGTVLDEDQLKAFVNAAEWSLGARR